ncbi:MAG: hypothetical protein WCK96_17590 [Methylococcales bacterium]
MKWSQWLANWDMTSLKISAPFMEMEWSPQEADKDAAWELYIELLTRITIQSLDMKHGDEKTALTSVHSIFDSTRKILKKYGRDCEEFAAIAIPVLNQIVRPFTAEWHGRSLDGDFSKLECRTEFRTELERLQQELKIR